MHGPINVKSPNNTSKWQMGFNSAIKGLKEESTNTCPERTQVTTVELRVLVTAVINIWDVPRV